MYYDLSSYSRMKTIFSHGHDSLQALLTHVSSLKNYMEDIRLQTTTRKDERKSALQLIFQQITPSTESRSSQKVITRKSSLSRPVYNLNTKSVYPSNLSYLYNVYRRYQLVLMMRAESTKDSFIFT